MGHGGACEEGAGNQGDRVPLSEVSSIWGAEQDCIACAFRGTLVFKKVNTCLLKTREIMQRCLSSIIYTDCRILLLFVQKVDCRIIFSLLQNTYNLAGIPISPKIEVPADVPLEKCHPQMAPRDESIHLESPLF